MKREDSQHEKNTCTEPQCIDAGDQGGDVLQVDDLSWREQGNRYIVSRCLITYALQSLSVVKNCAIDLRKQFAVIVAGSEFKPRAMDILRSVSRDGALDVQYPVGERVGEVDLRE